MRYLIVDGHSMVFAWADLAALHRTNREAARKSLVARLAAYHHATGDRVVVVFDGRGAKTTSSLEQTGVQVIYSRSGQTADAVIERLAANYGKEHDLRVATNDRAEQITVSTFGATFLSAGRLAEEIKQATENLSKQMRTMSQQCKDQQPRLGDLFKEARDRRTGGHERI